MGYIFILKKLAFTCFKTRKYSDAEKYFNVISDMLPDVTKNPTNLFAARKNLLLFYTYTDINYALEYGERMIADQNDFYPVHTKELFFMQGNVHFLRGDYRRAKLMYRKVLKMGPKPELEAKLLNNLAFACWMHMLDIPKI